MTRLIDLSHAVTQGQTTYPGIPAPYICDFLSREDSRSHYAEGVSFCINRIDMPGNTGTYMDSPFHRYADGIDLAQLPRERVADLDGIVCAVPDTRRAIGVDIFDGLTVAGKAVLVRTGWSRFWGDDRYFSGHPFLTREAADYLAGEGAALVGIDSLNIDDTDDPARPVHSILLGQGIPIVEHLCALDQLPQTGFVFHGAPVKVNDFGTFPIRAYAVTD